VIHICKQTGVRLVLSLRHSCSADQLTAVNMPDATSVCVGDGKVARYSTGIPMPRPQSLAKIKARESLSHTGEELLQFPAATSCSLPLSVSRSQICLGPVSVDSKAVHFLSGDTTELSLEPPGAEVAGAILLVVGSKVIVVDAPFFTSSR
jgi:hypothetical protein